MLLLVALAVVAGPVAVRGVSVDTKYGPVEGFTVPLHTGRSVNAFHGIPFAKPPVGDLRWREPEEPDEWEEPFQAFELGATCIQYRPNLFFFSHPFWNNYDEDCLNLNIFTPEDMSGAPYPVMFFIHGGSNAYGANIQYPGHFLADKGVVVVVPNYRLNIFGYASTKDDVALGNYGLLDQVAALRFVQENIEAFGGDPDSVTVFGESAGAENSGHMLISPLSAGLFHRAILQSGTEMRRSLEKRMEDDQNYMIQVADQLNCDGEEENEAIMDCLRGVIARRVLRANVTCTPGYPCDWRPRVDGHVIPDAPRLLRERGEYNRVPEMIGVNSEDGTIFQPIRTWLGANRSLFEDTFRSEVASIAPRLEDPEREEDLVQAGLFQYTPWPYLDDPEMNRDAIGRFFSDWSFGYHADNQAKLHSADGNTVYFYVYNYISKHTLMPEWMGCVHAAELAYLFGYALLDVEGNEELKNSTRISPRVQYDDTDKAYADFMITLWTNFAKTGNPTPEPVTPPVGNGDPVTWPTFEADDLTYMWLGQDEVETRQKFRQNYYAFFQHYLPYLEDGELTPFEDPLEEEAMDEGGAVAAILKELFPDLWEAELEWADADWD